MNMHVSLNSLHISPPAPEPHIDHIMSAAAIAAHRIAPLWPLGNFVAVNPFMGLAGHSVPEATMLLGQAGGGKLTRPLSFYANAITNGDILDRDIADALAEYTVRSSLPKSVAAFKSSIAAAREVQLPVLPTVADTASRLSGKDWMAFAADRISHWASHHFDAGQSVWRSPGSSLNLFAAWRAEAAIDMTPDISGLRQFRSAVRDLPANATEALAACVTSLGLAPDQLAGYFHRLFFSLGGWASYVRYLGWDKELAGETDTGLIELLAVRIAWEHGLLVALGHRGLAAKWRKEMAAAKAESSGGNAASLLHLKLAAHLAYELAERRKLFSCLPAKPADEVRPRAQAVFCIDVRSEVFRRSLETVSPQIETLGFAGFFGASIAYTPPGQETARAQVPVLLKPAFEVSGKSAGSAGETLRFAEDTNLKNKTVKSWTCFQQQAVSSFGFVETAGAGFGLKLLADAFGLMKKPSDGRFAPALDNIPLEGRLAMAENALRGMSLTRGFARLVLLVGHGSSSVNNPHASGLDCGACGGHTGEINARVMATILNEPAIRAGLREKDIDIPEDTRFLGALHNTTTDDVMLFNTRTVLVSLAQDAAWIEDCLTKASTKARTERAARLPGGGDLKTRATDWSQVRPEWGLAGCAAFIAAPRRQTKAANFKGRVFLHSYNWQDDGGFKVLELIMTAPMVVASWISLQYFASTIDNQNFGSGNKVLHNTVGTFGVLEGNSGVLRTGLPMQSVHDGEKFVHDPVRLSVVIAAPLDAMNAVIARHAHVRDLLDNGWLHLLAMDDGGQLTNRYAGDLRWVALDQSGAAAA